MRMWQIVAPQRHVLILVSSSSYPMILLAVSGSQLRLARRIEKYPIPSFPVCNVARRLLS
jgi:hypothetical protein